MNSVAADRILHISPPGEGYKALPDQAEVSGILFDLGYRNSDALFHDRLVCVEGKSDKHIIPLLLEKDGEIEPGELDRTGFPILEGSGRGSTGLQVSILRYEKLLRAVGRGNQPRIYVLDGDRRGDEKAVLEGTKNPITGQEVPVRFLPRLEIENYLLVPEAIASAVREELVLKGQSRDVSASEIETRLQELLENDDEHIFPQGREEDGDPFQEAKGSVVLERVYDAYGLTFNKERSGVLIAKHVSAKSQPAISELTNLLRPLFAKNRN
jgi:predicted ATP-dependent endonuclease of OLD family